MDPALAFTAADLAADEGILLRCACRERGYSRGELIRLVGPDARPHMIGLREELRRRGRWGGRSGGAR